MKKKMPLVFEELIIWLRGRFSLTAEEKNWMLLILIICWAGLVARYFYIRNQKPEPLTPQQMEKLHIPQTGDL